ncbi:MAG: outer membrane protein assembly factor BamD [Pseudomonadota bacterium]
MTSTTQNSITRTLIACALAASVVVVTGCGGSASSRGGNSDEEMYRKGDSALKAGSYGNAVGWFEALEVRFPFSEFTKQAQLDLIYAYHKGGQAEAAVDAADKFIRENPRHVNVDYAYYLKGLVYFERDRTWLERMFRVDLTKRPPSDATKAFNNFATLARMFPDSKYADDAAQRMAFLRNRLADYEKHVAEYYLKRKAYVAAINRSKYILENYPQAPAVADALNVQIAAYAGLGLDDLADDSRRVYNTNFGEGVPSSATAALPEEPEAPDAGLSETGSRKSLRIGQQMSAPTPPK